MVLPRHARRVATSSVAVVLVTLAASLSCPSAASATAPAVAPEATRSSTLLFTVSGCEGCTITAYNTRTSRYTYGRARVVGGKAALVVPTAATRPMSFDLRHPKGYGSSNAVAAVVIRYAGKRPGQKVTAAQAARAKRATWCWAGTTRSTQRIKLKVRTFADVVYGEPTYSIRAWVSPTLPSTGPLQPTWKGSLGHQDSPIC